MLISCFLKLSTPKIKYFLTAYRIIFQKSSISLLLEYMIVILKFFTRGNYFVVLSAVSEKLKNC